MTFESTLHEIADPSQRPSAQQLVNLSNLDREEARELAEAWPAIEAPKRLSLITNLIDLAEDNVELNFDAVFKTALRDAEADVRAAAVRGLYECEHNDLIPALTDMLRNDPDAVVRREGAIALGRFALAAEFGNLRADEGEAIKATLIESAEDLDEDDRVRARAIEALGAISGEDTENLIESIYHEEDSLWLKIGAADAMGRNANEVWLPLVLSEMESLAPEMRHAAAFAAGEIGDEKAIAPLKLLAREDPDREVQLVAIHALGEIGGAEAGVALKSLLYEGDDDLRAAIEEALAEVAFRDDPLNPGL